MHPTSAPPAAAAATEPATAQPAIAPVLDAIRTVEAAVIDVLAALQTMDHRRAAAEEGTAVETTLRGLSGASGFDIAIFIETARVNRLVPALWDLHRSGAVPWGLVRQITVAARTFRTDQLERMNRWFIDHGPTIAQCDVDLQQAHINVMLNELVEQRTVEQRERTAAVADRFVFKPRLDGSSETYGTWSPESTALLSAALHEEADAPRATPCPSPDTDPNDPLHDPDDPDTADTDDEGDGGVEGRLARATAWRGRQLAAALLRLVTRGRAGSDASTPPARFLVTVDTTTLTSRAAGTLHTTLPGPNPTVTELTLDRLACDAAIDAVVRDGTDLLAAQRYRPEVTAAVRRAVIARDQGCRWPTCTAPISWCDVHHVTPRAARGTHAVGNLVLLCRRHHTTVHRRGWRQTLAPDGTYTLRRRGRTYTSHLRTDRLPPPEPPPPPRTTGNRHPPADPTEPPHRPGRRGEPPDDGSTPF